MYTYPNDWIDKKIFWLTTVFAVTNNLFSSNFNATPEIYKYFESGRTDDIQKAVNFISEKLGFTAPIAQYDWSEEIDDIDETRGIMTQGRIVLSLANTGDKYTSAATTIHELMHYALIYRKNVSLSDKIENEKITDLAGLVLGFGKIILNGKVIKDGTGRNGILGALTLGETSYAYKKINELRNTNDRAFLTEETLNILAGKTSQKTANDNWEMKTTYVRGADNFSREITVWITHHMGMLFKKIKELLVVCVRKYKKKKCPFCNKMIPKDTGYCSYCKRQLIEKIK